MTSLFKAFGLFASVEWGLGGVKFLSPHSFSGKKGGVEISFYVHCEEYNEDFSVSIPEFTDDYLIVFIPNKKGDNCVIITKQDCEGKMSSLVNLKWISTKLKRKWDARITAPILHGT